MNIKKVTVVGAGTMGPGIAQVCAQSGFEVSLVDIKEEALQQARGKIKSNLDLFVEMNVADQQSAEQTLSKIHTTLDLQQATSEADLVIEAIPEDLQLKKKMFARLDKICPKEAILSSNTSSLSITELASATNRADKVVGLHWFTPPYVLPPVEVVKTACTSKTTINEAKRFVHNVKKVPIICKDSPGFVINRILQAMVIEALSILDEGLVESVEEIDSAVRLSFGVRLPFTGPGQIVDLGGADIWLATAQNLYRKLGHLKFEPPKILKKKVETKQLGIKTRKGFYEYTDAEANLAARNRDVGLIRILKQLGYL
jgi:3-hydroxybutyryl-CoA dehydrogenase